MARLQEEEKWEWEKTLTNISKSLNDNALFDKGAYGGVTEYDEEISTFRLLDNACVEFTAEVSRVIRQDNSKFVEIRTVLLSDSEHKKFCSILNNQMERYAKMVNKSIYNPAIKDRFMFKLDRKEEYVKLGIKRLGYWCRAIKLDADWIYLFDWDDSVHLKGLDSDDYDIRRLYGEFLQVPVLVVNVSPFVNGYPMDYERASVTFQPGRQYKFKLNCIRDDDDVHEAEYIGPVAETDKPTVVSSSKHYTTTTASASSSTTSTSDSDE